jgi:light-regulated signal transduction histidine kinase (bacteriophytochrome)
MAAPRQRHAEAGLSQATHARSFRSPLTAIVASAGALYGPGIAPGAAERIFEPFQRGSRTAAVGVGLGLAFAPGFAEVNGGRVWEESHEGQGATFVFAPPLAAVEAESLG